MMSPLGMDAKYYGVGDRIAHKLNPEQEHNSRYLDFDYLVGYSTLHRLPIHLSYMISTQ